MAAYNDPIDFLGVWITDSPLNQSGFSNLKYDRLGANAKVETDPIRRFQQLARAEKILIEDEAVLAPTLHVCFSRLIRPSVEGLVFHPYGVFVDFKYASIREEWGGRIALSEVAGTDEYQPHRRPQQ
jgi:oligopeptide transport system substrate-binding protein